MVSKLNEMMPPNGFRNEKTLRNHLIKSSCINSKVKETLFKLTLGQKEQPSVNATSIFRCGWIKVFKQSWLCLYDHHSALLFACLCSLVLQTVFFCTARQSNLAPSTSHHQFCNSRDRRILSQHLYEKHQEIIIESSIVSMCWVFGLCS